jgi:hypothetical protein
MIGKVQNALLKTLQNGPSLFGHAHPAQVLGFSFGFGCLDTNNLVGLGLFRCRAFETLGRGNLVDGVLMGVAKPKRTRE